MKALSFALLLSFSAFAGNDVTERHKVVATLPNSSQVIILTEWELLSGESGYFPMFLRGIQKNGETFLYAPLGLLGGQPRSAIGTKEFASAARTELERALASLKTAGFKVGDVVPLITRKSATGAEYSRDGKAWKKVETTRRLPFGRLQSLVEVDGFLVGLYENTAESPWTEGEDFRIWKR